jgi:uncharacterized protein YeaC (DUF1315 family)
MSEDVFLARMLAALTPEIVANLKTAVELGKWPDGRRLSDEQRRTCLQAVIVWEGRHLPEEQRTGYIDKGEKDGETCDEPHEHEEAPVRFLH